MSSTFEEKEKGDAQLSTLQCNQCGNPAKLLCPKCLEMDLPRDVGSFCSQECFKAGWGAHKALHKVSQMSWMYITNKGQGRSNRSPEFKWTGALRPHRVGPRRTVPEAIPAPDWATTGLPIEEQRSKDQRQIPVYSKEEQDKIREACRLGREVLDAAHKMVAPGVTTDEIDRVVHDVTVEGGAYPSPLNYWSFPKSVCTSVNEVICHGIPDRRELEEGDIVNVDVSLFLAGYHADLNETFAVGKLAPDRAHLIYNAYQCLMKAIDKCKPGARYRDIGSAIAKVADDAGLSVVTTYSGHGVGRHFHCAPNIPHYSPNKAPGRMQPGHVFTIEPMINQGSCRDATWPDQWTAVTIDGKCSAQFEHTLLITDDGCEVRQPRQAPVPQVP